MYNRLGKRVFDLLASSVALVCLSPILFLIAAAVRLGDGGPALFRQKRVGRNGLPFTLLKFRSMPVRTADIPSDRAGAIRITPVGRFIRRTNLDELPQLMNILRGDMSVVGPRPALPFQNELIAARASNGAIACRPGLTGLAQVSAYDGMPAAEKAALDARYAARVTLGVDAQVIIRTFGYLLKPPPVY
jgi:O-antigen biosynthesis protein WbqP